MASQENQLVEYVTSLYVSLDGRREILAFPRNATLSKMQKQLCSAFGKSFPMTQVELIVNNVVYNEFLDKPLLQKPKENDHINVIFAPVTDMTHIDICFRNQKQPTFEEDMQESSTYKRNIDDKNT